MDITEAISEIEGSIDYIEQQIDKIDTAQDADSDEGNAEHIEDARNALETLRGHVMDIVP